MDTLDIMKEKTVYAIGRLQELNLTYEGTDYVPEKSIREFLRVNNIEWMRMVLARLTSEERVLRINPLNDDDADDSVGYKLNPRWTPQATFDLYTEWLIQHGANDEEIYTARLLQRNPNVFQQAMTFALDYIGLELDDKSYRVYEVFDAMQQLLFSHDRASLKHAGRILATATFDQMIKLPKEISTEEAHNYE